MRTSPDQVEALCGAIRLAFRRLAAASERLLEPMGMTAGDRALLEVLARAEGEASLSDVARRMSVSRQHVHQALARLPDPGWVVARPDPDDRRALRLRLSRSGRAAWRRVRGIDRRFFASIAPALDPADAGAALRAIVALNERLARTANDRTRDARDD